MSNTTDVELAFVDPNKVVFLFLTVLDFQKKILGPAGPQVFIFCRQNKYSGRQKLY